MKDTKKNKIKWNKTKHKVNKNKYTDNQVLNQFVFKGGQGRAVPRPRGAVVQPKAATPIAAGVAATLTKSSAAQKNLGAASSEAGLGADATPKTQLAPGLAPAATPGLTTPIAAAEARPEKATEALPGAATLGSAAPAASPKAGPIATPKAPLEPATPGPAAPLKKIVQSLNVPITPSKSGCINTQQKASLIASVDGVIKHLSELKNIYQKLTTE